ncbi:MAG: Veg protein [Clostridiales bacterium]|nr:Veg protein [Clostridiales bacterium]
MIRKDDVSKLKEDISFCIGQKVRVTTDKGKKKMSTKEGIVESTYPNLFTVKFSGTGSNNITSFNYTEVLTNKIELIKCSDNSNIYQRFN